MGGRGKAAMKSVIGCCLLLAAFSNASCATRTTPSQDPHEQVCYLLYKNSQTFDNCYNPPYGLPTCTLQNHIPYEVVALYKLGATADRIELGYKGQGADPIKPPTGAVNSSNWQDLLGKNPTNPSLLYSDYVTFYRASVAADGANSTLSSFLPAVADGLFGKMWHGIQTLGYGFGETGDADMIAQGLAWMSTAYQPPGPLAPKATQTDLSHVMMKMHTDDRLPVFKGDGSVMFYDWLDDLAANYSHIMMEYDLELPTQISLTQAAVVTKGMSDSVIKLFIAGNSSSFVSEHMVNAVNSADLLMPYIDAVTRVTLLRRTWQSILYNYCIQNRPNPIPQTLEAAEVSSSSWETTYINALNSSDVHVHEIVFYLRELPSNLPDAVRHAAAEKVIQRFKAGLGWIF